MGPTCNGPLFVVVCTLSGVQRHDSSLGTAKQGLLYMCFAGFYNNSVIVFSSDVSCANMASLLGEAPANASSMEAVTLSGPRGPGLSERRGGRRGSTTRLDEQSSTARWKEVTSGINRHSSVATSSSRVVLFHLRWFAASSKGARLISRCLSDIWQCVF